MAQNVFKYYADLLILQYIGKSKAYKHVQTLSAQSVLPNNYYQTINFNSTPISGSFVLVYNGVSSSAINYNDSIATIQSKIQAVTGLGSVTATGSISSLTIQLDMTSVANPLWIGITSNTLLDGNGSVNVYMGSSSLLSNSVQNAFNLTGTTATGVQLNVIGKYVGASRSGSISTGPITLSDSDYLLLINFAIIINKSGSSLYEIQSEFNTFFPNQVLVFDYQNMQMSYLISSTSLNTNVLQMAVVQGLFPRPMAVAMAVILYPVLNTFFGFRTYTYNTPNNTPFNSYTSYQSNRPWLSYSYSITPV